MWKNSEEFSTLKYRWKKKWNKSIVDVLVFGSSVKGKSFPGDIDICLVFRKKIDISLVKEAENLLGEKYHTSSLTIDNFFTKPHSLAKTLLLEGKSIISGESLSKNFGLDSKALYSYELSNETASKKVRFVYLLRGRKEKEGLVKKWKGEFISNSAFIVPIENDEEVKSVMEHWKIKYARKKFLLID